MVRDKGQTGFRIETNHREIVEPKPTINPDKKSEYFLRVPRKDKDYTNTLNDSRFEILNKSPDCLTTVPRVPGFSFNN